MKKNSRRQSRRTSDFLGPLMELLNQDKLAKQKLSDLSISEEDDHAAHTSNPNMANNVWAFDRPNGEWALATYAESGSTRRLTSQVRVIIPKSSINPDPVEMELPMEDIHEFDPTHMLDYDDAARINNLHEAPLLFVLLRRYEAKQIYTACSEVLISVNPYRHIEGLYGEEKMNEAATSKNPKPHVYVIANNAYKTMKDQNNNGRAVKKNQSVIVSGESGAGKTEASKHVMRYLIDASKKLSASLTGGGARDATANDEIEKSIMQSNVILEAFGNAKTVRNDNSSRFGKYIKLRYDEGSELRGAFTEHFLLEKTRLVRADKGERNYHVFYQLLKGLGNVDENDDEELNDLRRKLKLGGEEASAEKFKMLSNGKCIEVNGVDDEKEFADLFVALGTVGVNDEELKGLFTVLACLLHLGNVTFSAIAEEGELTDFVMNSNMSAQELSDLLGLDLELMRKGLCLRHSRSGRGSLTSVNLSPAIAKTGLDALIKHVYGSLFSWLVAKINISNGFSASNKSSSRAFIGILDIFGFEIMQHNSLSQMCINFANEKLQQQFNFQVFVLEKELYVNEGLDAEVISFKDNQPVIDLFQKKPHGIMCLLEEHSMLSREIKTSQLISAFERPHLNIHENYVKSRFGNEDFIVKHFAGDVEYSANDLIAKNNDALQEDLKRLLSGSSSLFLKNTCSESVGELGEPGFTEVVEDFAPGQDLTDDEGNKIDVDVSKMAATHTVTSVFRSQLNRLVETLHSTEPHYIKCVKPNSSKSPGLANGALVLEQLKYSGVLEVVRIRREGFPIRLPFSEFHKRYEILCFGEPFPSARKASREESIKACEFICSKALMENSEFAKGKTMIFLRNGVQEKLMMQVRAIYAGMATRIQAKQRAKKEQVHLQDIKKKTVLLQNVHRMIQQKKMFKIQQQATLKAQTFMRGRVAKKDYTKKKLAAQKIESIIRGRQASEGYKQTKASIKLQSKVRSKKAQANLKESKNAATKLQSAMRTKIGHDDFEQKKKLVIGLQAGIRRHEQNQQFKMQKKSAIEAQNLYRMHQRRNSLLNKKQAVVKLQTVAREKKAGQEYKQQQDAALVLHSNIRRFLAKAKLEHMKLGLFSGKKRRNNSVLFKELGDYIEARENASLNRLVKEVNDQEEENPEFLFCDKVDKYNRKGRKQGRQVVVTNRFLYILDELKCKSVVNLNDGSLSSTSLSSMADDFVVLHLKGDRDLVLTCPHKTELVNTCSKVIMANCKKVLSMTCSDSFDFKTWGTGFSRLKGLSTIRFIFTEDETVKPEMRWKLVVEGDTFRVQVAPSLASLANQQLGTPRAQRFNIMIGGKARDIEKSVRGLSSGSGNGKQEMRKGDFSFNNLKKKN